VCGLEDCDDNDAAYVVPPSTTLVFLTKMSETCKPTSLCVIQVKNRRTTIISGEKLDVISRDERCEQTVDICRNIRFVHISARTVRDNADRITYSAESGYEVFVQQVCRSPIGMNRTKNYGLKSLTVLLHNT
jgi:hypothetical protein